MQLMGAAFLMPVMCMLGMLGQACTRSREVGNDLPAVHRRTDEQCGGDAWAASRQWPRLVPGTEGLNSACIDEAFPGTSETVAFDVVVSATGGVESLRLPAGLSPAKERCIRAVASGYIFLPARNCDGEARGSVYRAGFGVERVGGSH